MLSEGTNVKTEERLSEISRFMNILGSELVEVENELESLLVRVNKILRADVVQPIPPEEEPEIKTDFGRELYDFVKKIRKIREMIKNAIGRVEL